VDDAPDLDWIVERFARVQLQHGSGRTGRIIRPEENMDNYGSDNAADENETILRLMLYDPVSKKIPALIAVLQNGIDSYHAVVNGQTWRAGGGYEPGHKLLLTFTAALPDHEGMKAVVDTGTFFNEDQGGYRSSVTSKALFGFPLNMGSEKTRKDWY
jgi:hypothetical protein